MIDVDRATERRNARLQFAGLVLVAALLLFFVLDDKLIYLAAVPPLLLIAGYRSWNVERLSPLLAQYYGHAVTAGAADRMLLELGADRWLHDTWAAAGAPLTRLSALPADRIAAAMRDLDAAGPAPRELPSGLRAANRVAAVVLGLGLGGALGWSLGRSSALGWPVLVAVVLAVLSRVLVARRNRAALARIVAAMRTHTRAELTGLLDPTWADRRAAVVRELHRLADGPPPRTVPELRVIELLLAGGIVVGTFAALFA
jgi:hypothetical protein